MRTARTDVPGRYFLSGIWNSTDPTGGTLRSSVVHSAGRASTIPLAWLAAPLPGLFPLPPTRPASVVPGHSTSAPRRGVYWQTGAHPQKCHTAGPPAVPALHARSYKSGPGAARPLIQKRRMDRAHSAPVPAVHVDVRPPPGVSIDTPLLLRPIASMQDRAAGVDRSYQFFFLLLSLLARAGDTGGIEQMGQNHEPLGTLARPTQSG